METINRSLECIALDRLSLWVSREAIAPNNIYFTESASLFEKGLALELGQLGYRLANTGATPLTFAEYQERCQVLASRRGADVEYIPLFSNFPDDLPTDFYAAYRLIASIGLSVSIKDDRFGADPITQMQREDYFELSMELQKSRLQDSKINWIDLTIVTPEEAIAALCQWVKDLVYNPTSVPDLLWCDIFTVLASVPLDLDWGRITFKETLARLAADAFSKRAEIGVKTPTDLLRVFAAIRGQDVSLEHKVSLKGLKLSKRQRRAVVTFLSNCPNLREDLLRYRGLWIKLSDYIHPGDWASRHPNVAAAFDDLRNGWIKSFEARAAALPPSDRLNLLSTRPGYLVRQISLLIKEGVSAENIAATLMDIPPQNFSLPSLLTAYCALQYDDQRLALTKSGKPWPIKPRQLAFVDALPVLDALKALILALMPPQAENNPNRTAWVDPALDKIILPFAGRAESDSLLPLSRGSRLCCGERSVIRLFAYWKQKVGGDRTDLDLSALLLDETFSTVGRISFSAYGDGTTLAHSGDIQSAELGAAEFIDIKLDRLSESGTAYVLPCLLKYVGSSFKELEQCYAGWMEREKVDASNKIFDPASVVSKINVGRDRRAWIPFLLDVQAGELVVMDLYANGERTIEGNRQFPAIAQAMANYWRSRPTYGLLARLFVEARGGILTEQKELAGTVIDSEALGLLVRLLLDLTSSPPYFVEGGDSKDCSLGFLLPRVGLH
jgi:hypothetical protein